MKKIAALAVAVLLTLGVSASNPVAAPGQAANRNAEPGSELFALYCAACHGETGGGLAEARLAFPESHRRCESCHKPGNPDRQAELPDSFELMRGRVAVGNAFSIGEAPALRGPEALQAFGSPAALRAYIEAAMPRHAPGTLTAAQGRSLSAFVLELKANSEQAP